jgi:short-subunit dehydrogenase
MPLTGKVVMITGAREGIGAAFAQEFLRRGARLSLIDMSHEKPGYDDGGAMWTIGDITDEEVCRKAVANTTAEMGGIDILINNAGVGLYATASESSVQCAARIFDVNLWAPVTLTRLVLPQMRERRSGAVINIESIGSWVSLPWSAMYCASKHALHAYTRSLHHEVREEGIHVMSVVPGIVETRFREHVLGGHAPDGVTSISRTITPQSLAACVADGLVKGKHLIVKPRIAWAFWALDVFFPQMMHWYVRRHWTGSTRPSSPPVGAKALSARRGSSGS